MVDPNRFPGFCRLEEHVHKMHRPKNMERLLVSEDAVRLGAVDALCNRSVQLSGSLPRDLREGIPAMFQSDLAMADEHIGENSQRQDYQKYLYALTVLSAIRGWISVSREEAEKVLRWRCGGPTTWAMLREKSQDIVSSTTPGQILGIRHAQKGDFVQEVLGHRVVESEGYLEFLRIGESVDDRLLFDVSRSPYKTAQHFANDQGRYTYIVREVLSGRASLATIESMASRIAALRSTAFSVLEAFDDYPGHFS